MTEANDYGRTGRSPEQLCSVLLLSTQRAVEHSRSGEKHSTASRVFPYTSLVLYRFLRALQQNRAQSRLLQYLLIELATT